MNQLQALTMLTLMHTAPIQPQTFYVANLSENDGAKCGEYISITPMNRVQPITPFIMPEEKESNSEE